MKEMKDVCIKSKGPLNLEDSITTVVGHCNTQNGIVLF